MPISDLSVVQITVKGQIHAQACVNVLHYIPNHLGPQFTSTMTEILNAFRAGWRTGVLPHVSIQYAAVEYTGVEIRGTEPDPNNPNAFRLRLGETATIAGVAVTDQGALNTDPLPTYVAATIQKRSQEAGRAKRGSCRIGGLVEAQTEPAQANTLTVAARNALANAATFLKTVLSTVVAGDTLNPCIFSRSLMFPDPPRQFNDTLHARFPVVNTSVNMFVGSQVSRKQRATFGA